MSYFFQRVTPNKVPRFLASKWLSYHLLLDREEWKLFFQHVSELETLLLVRSSGMYESQKLCCTPADFLQSWTAYQAAIQQTTPSIDAVFRPDFSLYLGYASSLSSSIITIAKPEEENREEKNMKVMAQPIGPVVVMQLHRFSVTSVPSIKVLPGVFGPQTISWGVSLSFPQIVQNATTRQISYPLKESESFHRILWKKIQDFIRHHTMPTPLWINNTSIWSTIRLGHIAKEWIHLHKELAISDIVHIDREKLGRTTAW